MKRKLHAPQVRQNKVRESLGIALLAAPIGAA